MHEGAGDHACAAGEGLVLDTALVGADADVAGAEHGGKIGVGASGSKVLVTANCATNGKDIESVQRFSIGQVAHGMRDTRVDEMDGGGESVNFGESVEL
ncbi:MAG: hypothetical protein RLZ22_803 [Verrucomicrobiota bacterium]